MVQSFRSLFITFGLIGIFVFAMMSFIVVVQEENDVSDTILNNEIINDSFTRLGGNLSEYRDTTQGQKTNFESEIPERGFGSLIIFSIVSIGQKVTSIIVGTYNVLIVLPASILGVSSVVMSVIGGFLLVTLVLLVWRVYRVGG